MSLAPAIEPRRAPSPASKPAPAAKPVRLRAPRGGITLDGVFVPGGRFLPPTAAPALEDLARRASAAAARGPVVIGICGYSYRVEPLAIAPAVGSHAFALVDSERGREYHLHKSIDGEVVCDCGDFAWRKAGTGQPCKHGRRLVELGLIPTRPAVLPPFAQRAATEAPTAEPASRPGVVATPAAVAGFERWARDRMAGESTTQFRAAPDATAEAWRRRGEDLGLAGRLVPVEAAFPHATPRQVLLFALDYTEAQWRGFRDFARQVGYAAGLDGGPADRPASIPGRFDDAWVAGFEEGEAERRERDRIMAGWQAEAAMERWACEEAAEANGYYRAALAHPG